MPNSLKVIMHAFYMLIASLVFVASLLCAHVRDPSQTHQFEDKKILWGIGYFLLGVGLSLMLGAWFFVLGD